MREKAMREMILAQLGALRADAGVEQVACKDTCVGDYLTVPARVRRTRWRGSTRGKLPGI